MTITRRVVVADDDAAFQSDAFQSDAFQFGFGGTINTQRVSGNPAGAQTKRVNAINLLLLEDGGFLLLEGDMGSDGLLLEGDMTTLGGITTKRVPEFA